MASSTVVANLINREVENSDAWSLGCDITIEEMDVVVEEIKLNDIAIAGVIKTDDISVDIDHDKNNVMDLDVNVVIDGLNSSIVESQVVPYERVVKINDLSPESSYEKGFAASAKSVKKVKDSVDSLDNSIKTNASNISKVTTDIESLTRRVDRLSEEAGGEDLGGIWYIDESTGNLVTDKQVEIKNNLIVQGDTASGAVGEDPGIIGGFLGVKVGEDEYKYVTPDGLLDMTDAFKDLDVDLSDYYTQKEIDDKITNLNLSQYALDSDLDALEKRVNEADGKVGEIEDSLDNYLLKKAESQTIEGDITIKGNLVVEGDTSTGGTGQDFPSGIDEAQLKEYLDTNKYITSDYAYSKEEVNRLIDEVNAGDIDLTNYYTKEEVDNKIAAIDVSEQLKDYAKTSEVDKKISDLNISQYATKASLETLQGEVDTLESVLGIGAEAQGVIDTWNEVKSFLGEIEVGEDLTSILEGMNAEIAKKALDSDLEALGVTVQDNAGNIKKNFDATEALTTRVKAEEDITATYKPWWDDLKSLIVKDGANTIKINGNLIITGDTASGARGTDGGADGTLIGVVVNGTQYKDETNGMLDLSTLMNQYVTSEWITNKRFATISDLSSAIGPLSGRVATLESAGYITSAALNGYAKTSDLPTSLPASDVYAWAKKSSLAVADVPDLSSRYLSVNGGTITSSSVPLYVDRTLSGDGYVTIGYLKNGAAVGYLGFDQDGNGIISPSRASQSDYYALIHSGNISYYALPLSGGTITGTTTDPIIVNTSATSVGIRLQINKANKAYVGYGSSVGAYLYNYDTGAYIGVDTSGSPFYHNGTIKNTLIHSGNYSDYALKVNPANINLASDTNVAGYGQTAEGWPVAGPALLLSNSVGNYAMMLSGRNGVLRFNTREAGNLTGWKTIAFTDSDITGYSAGLKHSNGTVGAVINSSGNVTIGASDLAGTTYKMSVDGKVHIRATASAAMNEGSGSLIVGNGAVLMIDANDIQAKTNGTTAGPLYINDWGGNVILCGQNNGNVGIGTTSPSYKLDVIGAVRATGGFKSVAIGIECDVNGNTSGYGSEINRFGANLYLQSREGNLYLSHSAGTTYISGLASIAGAVTMTSTLSVKTIKISSTEALAHLAFGRAGFNYVSIPKGGTLAFAYDNLSQAGSTMYMSEGVVTINGNAIITGDTATGSDIRFKDILDNKTIDIKSIAEAPLFTFKWNDRKDDNVHLGTSAQYWENITPWLVKGDEFKTLDYSTLGVAIGISLANKAVNHEERIKILEKENKALKEQIRRIQYGS